MTSKLIKRIRKKKRWLSDRKVRKATRKQKTFYWFPMFSWEWFPIFFWIMLFLMFLQFAFIMSWYFSMNKIPLDLSEKDAIIKSHVATISTLNDKIKELENRPEKVVTKVEKVYVKLRPREKGFINIPERRGTQIR